jgi:hypothetical protein
MAELPQAAARGRSRLLYVPAVLAWVVLSVGYVGEGETGGETAGRVAAALVLPLAVALLARLVYVKLLARSRPCWSPWIFVVAAGVGLLFSVARAAERDGDAAAAQARFGLHG